MTAFDEAMEFEANEMMDGILEEASDSMSPTLTPFLTLGTDDPAMEIMDGPTTARQAEAKDLFEAFDHGSASESRMKNSGLFRSEALDL
ncbi:MAG: hypothetical protein ACPGWS_01085 [Solirubrobacterales bacterium]